MGLEQIYIWNPEVIIVNEPRVKKKILKNRQWAALKAVIQKKVYQMPLGISRWGHPGSIEIPLSILWLSKKLYPDDFKEIDMVKETKNFYTIFFNYELSDSLAQDILSGKLIRKPKKRKRDRKS